MSRLSLLAGAVLALAGVSGVVQAAVVFEPLPVPSGECYRHYSRLNARYVKQLHVLNNYPYKTYLPAPASAYDGVPPVIDLMQQPCGGEQNNYYRKGDLMPGRVEYRSTAAVRPTGVSAGKMEKGMILIFPKGMMNRPLKEFKRGEVGREVARAE